MSTLGSKDGLLPRRRLGSTGEELSVLGMGGIVLMGHEQTDANRIVRRAVDRGLNYVDVAPSYGDGEAEEKTGPALVGLRDRIFLACKTARRDRAGAREELERSLARLRTDHFDLYQLHGLTSVEEVRRATGPGGALETLIEAKERGETRFLGFSAHSEEAALAAMEAYPFDTVLFPLNWSCWQVSGFGPHVVDAARSRGMGILALKAMAYRPWPEGAERTFGKAWYEPVSDADLAALALRFTLSLPVTAAIPPGHARLFEMAMSIPDLTKPLDPAEAARLSETARSLTPLFPQTA